MPEDEYVLHQNSIVFEKDSANTISSYVSTAELSPIIKQRANRRVLRFLKLHLWIYNRSNEKRIERLIPKKQKKTDKINLKINRKNKKIEQHNDKLDAKGSTRKRKSERTHRERKMVLGEWFQKIGEAPVIIDSAQTERGRSQISIYLASKGYFHNEVTDTLFFGKRKGDIIRHSKKHEQRKNATVEYRVKLNTPYLFNDLIYESNQDLVMRYLDKFYSEKNSLIQKGKNFDIDLLDKERANIAGYFLLNGFYGFRKDYIVFEADTNGLGNKVNVLMKIVNPKIKEVLSDELKEIPHRKFRINNITVIQNIGSDTIRQVLDGYKPSDVIEYTLDYKGKKATYIFKDRPTVKPRVIQNNIMFTNGELYSIRDDENTRRKLSGLGPFRTIRVQSVIENDSLLNVVITLETSKKQNISFETSGLNNAGLLGVRGAINYNNRNLLGGAENLRVSLSGGLEAQRSIVESDETNQTVLDELGSTFNTTEIGPSISFTIPRFLFTDRAFQNFFNTRTEFTAKVNYQKRPDFTRGIEELTFSYSWKTKPTNYFKFNVAEISAVEITKKSAEFESQINNLNDRSLAASFSDHIIAGTGFLYEYNNRSQRTKNKDFIYYRSMLESAGNSLRLIYSLTDRPTDAFGSYELFNIRFAQFVKTWHDFRYYRVFSPKHATVYRIAGGLGVPLANLSEALPFEKSFFSGGANGMRAWRARTLGPGSFRDPNRRFDKIGDIHLEGNLEYRFDIVGSFEGALFIDAGNIWQLRADSLRPGGNFDPNRFVSEIALGTGVGVRYDLDFFIIRFDFAIPFKNPAMDIGRRFIWQATPEVRKDFYRLQFNLGIGYPF